MNFNEPKENQPSFSQFLAVLGIILAWIIIFAMLATHYIKG